MPTKDGQITEIDKLKDRIDRRQRHFIKQSKVIEDWSSI